MHIHTDQPYFNAFRVPQLTATTDTAIYPPPATLQLVTGMNDIWLSLFRQPALVAAVKSMRAGEMIKMGGDIEVGLFRADGKLVVKVSSKFKERLKQYKCQGYTFSRAEVAQVVVWWCQKDSRDYRIVFPRVELRKVFK